jgi:Protein of unknown function (DUF3891)
MIIPPDQPPDRTITISQTSHSWISGQLARVWGNDLFARFDPFEQICYAAEQHDIGFLDWESQPTLNLKTGLPYTFDELPESIHFEIWEKGIFQLRPSCYYASLVVSLHFSNLCQRFHRHPSGPDRPEVDHFLKTQSEHQNQARETLERDPILRPAVAWDVLTYHRDLIAVWDWLSLELCRGRSAEFKLPSVPIFGAEPKDLLLRQREKGGSIWEVDPWPFAVETLTTFCEGRVLNQRFTDTEEMRQALSNPDRVTILFNLVPPGITVP